MNRTVKKMIIASLGLAAGTWAAPEAQAKKTATVMLIPDSLYISPNNDGVGDVIKFQVKTENVRDVVSWDIQFKDSAQIVRKTLSGLKGLPEEIVWEGTDEFGARAPEGGYEVLLKVWDSRNQFIEASVQKVTLDMTPPTLSLAAQGRSASFKDGALSPITFYFSAVDLSGLKEWKIQFLDEKRQAFHMESAIGAPPSSWTYNGADLPAGTKRIMAILGVTDMAGNRAASPPIEIDIDGGSKGSERQKASQPAAAAPVPVPPPAASNNETEPGEKAEPRRPSGLLQMTSVMSIGDLFGDEADGDTQLLEQAEVLLAPLAQALLDSPGSRATIIGHVDSSLGAAQAKTLSSYFAWKVFSYFVKDKGVDKNSLSVKGLGSDVPIADNRTTLGRTRNRRIEIQLFLSRNRS